jgi:Putative Actinobacterial Holin-X, holin superfamily III
MVRTARPDGIDEQHSLGELVAQAAKDMSSLVRYEISLALSELKMDARRIAIAAGIAVVVLFVACLIVVLLCFALAYGLVDAFGIPIFAGFLCTVGACLVISAVAVAIAILVVRRVTGMKMTRKTVMDDIGMLRRSEPSPNGSGPAVNNTAVSSTGASKTEVGAGKGTTAEIPPARP